MGIGTKLNRKRAHRLPRGACTTSLSSVRTHGLAMSPFLILRNPCLGSTVEFPLDRTWVEAFRAVLPKRRREAAMTEQHVQDWLDEYGRAWVDGDPDRVVALFSATAIYRETPFDDAMRGLHAIREYWQSGAADAQKYVEFASQVWAVTHDTAIAGWQARFTRKASGAQVELDGTFRLVFSGEPGALQCTELQEWWHSRES